MLWLLPYTFSALVGMTASVALAGSLGHAAVGTVNLAIGFIGTAALALGLRIHNKLSELDQMIGLDRRVQLRLSDNVRYRQQRLVLKRGIVLLAAFLAAAMGGLGKMEFGIIATLWITVVGFGAAVLTVVGGLLLFIESTAVDRIAVDWKHYQERIKRNQEEAAKMQSDREKLRKHNVPA